MAVAIQRWVVSATVVTCLALMVRADEPSVHTVGSDAEPAAEAVELPAGHSQHGEAFNEGPRQKAYLMGTTGAIRFAVSSEVPQVQEFVEQGIGQVHGFWYFEAERSFRQAAMLDPNCAIAYWGMAMANANNSKRAQEFIAEAVRRKMYASERESLYIDALNAYLAGKGEQRAKDYVAAWEDIAARYPDDLEARAFLGYALYKHRSDLKRSYEEVDAVLKQVLAEQPMHPVHHYRIHLWDLKTPENALDSAALAGQSSPGIAHMWHMPGHIYSRLKRYEDAAWQQEASARVDHAHMMRDRVLPDQIHNFAHNNEWLIRDLSHVGRFHDAVDLAKNMTELPQHPRYNTLAKRGSAYYGRLRLFEVLYRYELWDEMIALANGPHLEPTDRVGEQLKRLRHLGAAYFRSGRLDEGRGILAEAEQVLAANQTPATAAASDSQDASASAGEDETDDQKGKQTASENQNPAAGDSRSSPKKSEDPKLMAGQLVTALRGHLAVAEGKTAEGLELLRRAGSEDKLYLARLQSLSGDHEGAIKSARAQVKADQNQVHPLAVLAEILWRADKKEEAAAAFEELRNASSSIQLDSPVFQRLSPVAAALGLPADWRVVQPPPQDVGQRPSLDSLGPFRWQPRPAADWVLKDAEGNSHSLKQYHGKPVLVIFYLGYGCLHCAEQLQKFAPRAAAFDDAGISIIAISTDDQSGLEVSLKNHEGGMPFPLVANAEMDVFKAYRAYDDFEDLPLHGTFLIDAQGRVRWQDISYEPFMDVDFVLSESQRLLAQ